MFYRGPNHTIKVGQIYSIEVGQFRLSEISPGLAGIRQALTATRHLLELYRRQRGDENISRKLQRLDRRLLAVASQLEQLASAEK